MRRPRRTQRRRLLLLLLPLLFVLNLQGALRHEWTQHLPGRSSDRSADVSEQRRDASHAQGGPCLLCLAHAGANLGLWPQTAALPAPPSGDLPAIAVAQAGRAAGTVALQRNRGPPAT